MIKDTHDREQTQAMDEAKRWWNQLTEYDKNQQMKQGKLFDVDKAKRVGRSQLMDWDQIDLEQYRQRIMGNNK